MNQMITPWWQEHSFFLKLKTKAFVFHVITLYICDVSWVQNLNNKYVGLKANIQSSKNVVLSLERSYNPVSVLESLPGET